MIRFIEVGSFVALCGVVVLFTAPPLVAIFKRYAAIFEDKPKP